MRRVVNINSEFPTMKMMNNNYFFSMNKCADNDNSCTYVWYKLEDGTEVKRNKRKYETSDFAIAAAKNMNAMDKTIHKYVAYKCNKCGYYHIGHTNKVLTDKDRQKARDFVKYYKLKKA